MRTRNTLLMLYALYGLVSCETIEKQSALQEHITSVKNHFAPDKRVAMFQVDVEEKDGTYILKGESNLPQAVDSLTELLQQKGIVFQDRVRLLPSADLNGKTEGLVTISVANLRSDPKHSAELATQATLGTPLKIYKKEGDWSLVQTPDGYLAWVDAGGILPMDAKQMKQWRTADKIVYLNTYGHAYTTPNDQSPVVSDLVAGNVLETLDIENGFFVVKYPDGRKGYVNTQEAKSYREWLSEVEPSGERLEAVSKTLMGLPYLWGGTSTKGVDCSGFTKTIYFLNGIVLPRDASQQVHVGQPVDSIRDFSKLEKGDLLFFGRKATDSTAEKVVHVGMWIGNNEFIHSSGQVHISSMDSEATNFDAFNRNRYLRTKRMLTGQRDGVIRLGNTTLFKD